MRDFSDRDSDEYFEKVFEFLLGEDEIIYGHFSNVAGVTFPNADGSDRLRIIGECKMNDYLVLKFDADNPVDPHAIGIYRASGEQLGYMSSISAKEKIPGIKKRGEIWVAMFRRILYHPPGTIAGAVVYFMNLTGPGAQKLRDMGCVVNLVWE